MPTPSRDLLTVVDQGHSIGRDPRRLSEAELSAAGIVSTPVLTAIREKCVDCSGGNLAEVAKCTAIACALWPFRMNTNPFRTRKDASQLSEAQLAARASNAVRLRSLHAAKRAS